MAKKLYEVEYDDNLHMADAADDPEYKRGLLYDDDGNLKAHAKMREVDEDELRDRYAEREQYDYSYDYDDYERRKVELTPEQQELAQLAGEALAAMLIALIAAASPHIQHWWEKTAVPGIKEFFGGIGDFFKGIGRKPKSKQVERSKALQLVEASLQIDPKAISEELDTAYEGYRENMSSEEAQKALVEVAILASMLAERIKKLSNAKITGEGIAGGYLGWQETVNRLSSRELIDDVNRILEGDVRLFDAAQIANLELILGRSLYKNGQYVPIESNEFRERLMPGLDDGMQDEGSDDEGPLVVA
ncbi:hypothetical protein [Adlercreutzia sp. ZJ242]|uniref:hypothetical protein n=1 Tax=Adlercreutzia sp. ZJ242 TaxID=2709409 RepID=UPI0013EA925D|nr:hypothetical protein [Adlercreutzia sp. ZJ242]